MEAGGEQHKVFSSVWRKLKYNYIKLIRSKGAPHIIARSYAIGVFVEFITLPTLGLAFLLMYPIIRLVKGNFAVALIGFTLNKAVVPIFWVLDYKVGSFILNKKINGPLLHELDFFHLLTTSLHNPLELVHLFGDLCLIFLVGSSINGFLMAWVWYFIVFNGINIYRKAREERSANARAVKHNDANHRV